MGLVDLKHYLQPYKYRCLLPSCKQKIDSIQSNLYHSDTRYHFLIYFLLSNFVILFNSWQFFSLIHLSVKLSDIIMMNLFWHSLILSSCHILYHFLNHIEQTGHVRYFVGVWINVGFTVSHICEINVTFMQTIHDVHKTNCFSILKKYCLRLE